MVKAYLRYEPVAQFGVTASSSCNVSFSDDANLVFSGSLEDVNAWSVRQGTLVSALRQGRPESVKAAPAATRIAHSPTPGILAVGYADGSVRVWKTDVPECLVVLSGHTSAVTALAFSRDGDLLASGSQDTDIIVWDVVGEVGLYKLRAHTDQVTDVVFLDAHNMLVSGSKDGAVRVWDLTSRHCCQYIPIHVGEVWALAVDPSHERVVLGSTDSELRMFAVSPPQPSAAGPHQGDPVAADAADRKHVVLSPIGSLARESTQRVAQLSFSPNGALLAASSTGKQLQLWHKRAPQEVVKKQKRRRKRQREKSGKHGDDGEEAGGAATSGDGLGDTVTAADEWAPQTTVRVDSKVSLRSFAFAPVVAKHTVLCQLALGLSTNSIHVVNVLQGGTETVLKIEGQNNSSSVRALALAEGDLRLLTTGGDGTKVWNPTTGACLNTISTGYGLCCLFAPGGRFAVVATKDGQIEILDVGAAEVVERVDAHSSQVWSIAPLPKGKGFVTGSADKTLKFWHWATTIGEEPPRLTLKLATTVNTGQDVLCVRVSPNGSLVAASLISNVIKVFYLDTMKWFVDLYGHKLPALTMDISSDNALLVSGSADKNIKIWGLDFGDCHKSLFAHQDSVMAVAFVPNTHYVFTAGKDKMLKYWDADKFELLLELPAHHAEVWCLAISRMGDFVVTGSHDRSLRRWERTDEPFFVDEEKERRLESLFENVPDNDRDRRKSVDGATEEGVVEAPAHKSQESVDAVDRIIEALDMAAAEVARQAEASGAVVQPNPFLLGLSPSDYVLRLLSDVKANDLESVLIMLPFTDALKLLTYLSTWLGSSSQVELAVRTTVLLLKLHHGQLTANPSCRPLLANLQVKLRTRVQALKNVMGFNLAGMRHVQRCLRDARSLQPPDAAIVPIKRKLAAVAEA